MGRIKVITKDKSTILMIIKKARFSGENERAIAHNFLKQEKVNRLFRGTSPNQKKSVVIVSITTGFFACQSSFSLLKFLLSELETLGISFQNSTEIDLEAINEKIILIEPYHIKDISKEDVEIALEKGFYIFFINVVNDKEIQEKTLVLVLNRHKRFSKF